MLPPPVLSCKLGNDEQDTKTSVKLPPELVVVLRDLVLDAGEAERRPSLRSRLWPLLARASPKEAEMLQVTSRPIKREVAVIEPSPFFYRTMPTILQVVGVS